MNRRKFHDCITYVTQDISDGNISEDPNDTSLECNYLIVMCQTSSV